MKYFLMILVAMAAGCSFDYKSPDKMASDMAGDTPADSLNSIDNDGEAGEEVEFNPPLSESDSEPPPIDTGPDTEDGEETAVPDDDVMEDETPETADATDTATNPLKDTADSDESGDAPDVPDSDSDGADSNDTVEPGADTNDTPDAEAETSLPCIPNCAGKQCGNDGCDGSCGSCPNNFTCNANFVCECVVGCQIPTEPTADAADATNAADADAGTTTTADADAEDSVASPDETNGPTAETTVTMDATVDAPQSEINPSVDVLVNAEPSADTNVVEVAAEIANEDTATTTETATNADIATEAETETSEDASEPDTFVLPCLANPLFCDDGNECTVDTCTMDGCQHEPQTGMTCNDGDACTTVDTCEKDVCAGAAIICNDQNPCTDDSCDEQSGCVYTSNNANPCEDGSLCTVNDYCDVGKCQGGNALKCEDGNLCTDDVCQPQKGCVYPANQAGCDDGNSCTVGDICADMACASGTNICQCQNDADCASADDENLCNGTIVCDQSAMPFVCVTDPNTIITCNVSQDTACLKNTCVPATGDCQMTAVNEGGGCDDGNACTSNDQCAGGSCTGKNVKCDDNNVCTDDSCDTANGCVFTPNKADCDDGSICTLVDECADSQCIGTAEVNCSDFNECTLDVCNKTAGCLHSEAALNGEPCDNGDACTVNDTCQNGACQAGTQNNCDCYTTADCAGKEDSDFCNGTLICDTVVMPHKCVLDPTTVITCPITQDTECLKNTCQPASGKCEMEAVNEDGECDDGSPCTEADACKNGVCQGTPKPTGTVIFQDNFDDGNFDGWTVETWNTCPNCSMCPCVLPTVAVTEEAPFWVNMSPLAGSGHVLLTSPTLFLPKGGIINFLFAGANCAGTGSVCEVSTNWQYLGYTTSYNNCSSQPPTCLIQFNITEADKKGQVMLEFIGISSGSYNACGAAYLDDFSIICP